MTDYKSIKTFDELIEREHSKLGTDSRNAYEEGAQLFTLNAIILPTHHHNMDNKVYIEDAFDEAVLSPGGELMLKVIAAKQVLKLNVFSREKTLQLYGVTESDLRKYA
ncbi:hypothetical protein [Pontibacter sp. BAB1700]|uniref:hypothetical protein n=1 Tax=Pontibacter sp. BAB1700 TaxID=1144253 RepID=UPI00026BC97D|nr:hypothetical protein [Pontibacter sp. BAB1700]EJF10585.1 hypothetical protein O71_08098 [Pontibacter sp. BAB1700]